MNLKHFSWSCLLIGIIPVVYQVVLRPDQNRTAASLFTSTMILMAVGFNLVRRELAKLQPGESDHRPSPRPQ